MKNLLLIIVVFVCIACKKFIDVEPPSTQLVTETVFKSDQAATTAQLAIYARMEGEATLYQQILYSGLSADELSNYSTTNFNIDLATNNLSSDNSNTYNLWTAYYRYIYQANDVLNGVAKSSSLSFNIKKQLTGEAKFARAYFHFLLVNLFGAVPIVNTTDYRINALLPRSSVHEVYNFIKEDLQSAVENMSINYLDAAGNITTERVRPNRNAAKALLARVYLYMKDWTSAELLADEVIASNYQLVSNLDNVFLKNSTEAIWQLQNVAPNTNTYSGSQFILTTTPTVAALDTGLINSFAVTDKRKLSWTKSVTASGKTYYYPNKYKIKQSTTITEYSMIFRLAELFLIRSEARLQQGNIAGAQQDINIIRTRAGLPNLMSLTAAALQDSLIKERRWELFSETGDRWMDLKRTGAINIVMPFAKGLNWVANDSLYPIPLQEINRNTNLTQNLGY